MKNKAGFSEITIALILAVIVVVISFFIFKTNKINLRELGQKQQVTEEVANEAVIENGKSEISSSSDIETIETELNTTLAGDPEVDTESLNNDASSL